MPSLEIKSTLCGEERLQGGAGWALSTVAGWKKVE